jgi:hypothetical protein
MNVHEERLFALAASFVLLTGCAAPAGSPRAPEPPAPAASCATPGEAMYAWSYWNDPQAQGRTLYAGASSDWAYRVCTCAARAGLPSGPRIGPPAR